MYILLDCFFFFKQKTAYEMRISDWSSDVCSSDLQGLLAEHELPARQGAAGKAVGERQGALESLALRGEQPDARRRDLPPFRAAPARCPGSSARSEEHTSELQSLMRISYAVSCLTKKKTTTRKTNQIQTDHMTNHHM